MRIPVVPTLMVALMTPVLVGLGFWQLDRAEWKADLLARLEAAPSLPPVEIEGPAQSELDFRRARTSCTASGPVEVVAGRNANGVTGFSYRVPCRGADGTAVVLLDIGWSNRPGTLSAVELPGPHSGILVARTGERPHYLLVSRDAAPPLEPSAPPSTETIPNNHMAYAVQWFFFAAALLTIYGVYLFRRDRK
jgi:cytochrome oxidase assembly protein ShyY1